MKLEFLKNGMYKGKKYKKGSVIDFETQDTQVYLQINLCRISLTQDKEVIIKDEAVELENKISKKKKSKTKVGAI
jgi:hypothetical protein